MLDAAVSRGVAAGEHPAPWTPGRKAALALACVVGAFLPPAAGFIPGVLIRFIYLFVLAVVMLAVALLARRNAMWHPYWEIPLVGFGMALFWLADNFVPGFLRSRILHIGTTSGNPTASTVFGTIIIQLDELVLTVIAVAVVLLISRTALSSIYFRPGRFGRAYVIGIVGFIAFYVLTFRVLSHTTFLPVHGKVDFARYLSLTPALLVVVGTNAFLEELLFRGLLMSKLNMVFGPYAATMLQAVIFASWHVGVTYAASALIFVVLVVFPLGLVAGYLTRSSGSILPGWLFHAGADMPIYLGFLTAVSLATRPL